MVWFYIRGLVIYVYLRTKVQIKNELCNNSLEYFSKKTVKLPPALDNVRRSASVSPGVIEGFLRSKIGFNGLVITDAVNMKGVEMNGPIGLSALKAGADIVLSPEDTAAEIDRVCEAVRNGEISIEEINAKCRKVLMYKYRFVVGQHHRPDLPNLLETLNAPSVTSLQQRLSR